MQYIPEELWPSTTREITKLAHTLGSDVRDEMRHLRGVSMASHQSGIFTKSSVHVSTNGFYAPAEDARIHEEDHALTLRTWKGGGHSI